MRPLLLSLFMLFLSVNLSAQQLTISGTVTSLTDRLPLPGVNVIVKRTSNGVQTDFDGFYTIQANKGDVLEFSFIGMTPKTVKVKDSNVIDVALQEDAQTLEEIVVVGYSCGSGSKSYGNFRGPRPNVSSMLRGVTSGVHVTSLQGKPGAITSVRTRGENSKTHHEPLFILDGQPVTENYLRQLGANKIKHIEILSPLQGKVLYDYEGSKGVAVIRTKGQRNPTMDFSVLSEFLNESYAPFQENHFKTARIEPLSTFSIDVDKASYSNIRRMINNGQSIPKHAVRIEEMINYFKYDYAQPENDHPFSIHTDVIKTPWHDDTQLVRIGLQGKTYDNDELPASNLTFLIDVSGSMSDVNKLELLKKAFKLLVNQLREKDTVSIVVYAGAAGVVLNPTSGNQKEKILTALQNLAAGGSTAGGAGIELAYRLAQQNFKKNGNNRVILATDGDFNVGPSSDGDMQQLIAEKRKTGIFLSVLGFGYGNYKDSKLETLADKGNGNHAYIDNMQEARKVFGKEFGGTLFTIAKDVKIQVEFNPKKVQAYRLIGYENRLLAHEDFKDDTKDAGELGSGHTVTALYEIVPTGVSTNYTKNSVPLKYTSTTISDSFEDELFTVKFRYKAPNSSTSVEIVHIQDTILSDATEDMNFLSAIALFGMKLQDSKYDNNASFDKIISLANKGRGEDTDGYRAEFIRLVESYLFL